MRPPNQDRSPFPARRLIGIAAGLAVAAGVIWLSFSVHLKRACVVADTPYLPLCNPVADGADLQRELRSRIAANPGDSSAWIQLANREQGQHESALLRAASALAPNEPNVLMWRAGEALAANHPSAAVALLVQLVEYRNKGEAAQVLARILASAGGLPLLRPHLATAGRWLPQVIANLAILKLPATVAQPLVAEAWAKGSITRQTLLAYIRSLKAEESWVDAYGLWLGLQQGSTPLLHNGRFDQVFLADGFDWEVAPAPPSRAGSVVSQRGSGNRGLVLEVELKGKPLATPIIRQYVFAPPGRYTLRGQYMGTQLRSEQGLAWTARCSNRNATKQVAGRSVELNDTGGAWKGFEFPILVSSDCGTVVSVQLEASSPIEAASGIRGRMLFDALEMTAQPL